MERERVSLRGGALDKGGLTGWWGVITGLDNTHSHAERVVTINTCQELERLESLQNIQYDKLKLLRVCLEGQEGLIRGYCQHDYKPIREPIK